MDQSSSPTPSPLFPHPILSSYRHSYRPIKRQEMFEKHSLNLQKIREHEQHVEKFQHTKFFPMLRYRKSYEKLPGVQTIPKKNKQSIHLTSSRIDSFRSEEERNTDKRKTVSS